VNNEPAHAVRARVLRRRHACRGAVLRRAGGAPPHRDRGRRPAAPADRRGRHHHRRVGRSFTALAYALHGERLFSEYEQRFLKARRAGRPDQARTQSVQLVEVHRRQRRALGARCGVLRRDPVRRRHVRRPARNRGRSRSRSDRHLDGLAARVLPERLRPCCARTSRKVRLSRAAATSSAVPVVLSPVTFNNYGGTCRYEYPTWVADVAKTEERIRPSARACSAIVRCGLPGQQGAAVHPPHRRRRRGHIGIRSVLETSKRQGRARRSAAMSVRRHPPDRAHRRECALGPKTAWDRSETPPGPIAQLLQASGVPIDRYSFETVEMMKDRQEIYSWRREIQIARARLAGAPRRKRRPVSRCRSSRCTRWTSTSRSLRTRTSAPIS